MMDRQIEASKLAHTQKLEAMNIEADISESKALYKHDQSEVYRIYGRTESKCDQL